MIIISEIAFPPESSKDIGKVFLKLGKLPDFMTLRGPYIRSESGKAITSLTLYECDDVRLAEGFNVVANRMIAYFEVKGFTYAINVWMEAKEALKMVGLG